MSTTSTTSLTSATARKPSTLLEVARAAGVSTATVTRVLRSHASVAEDTRERVEAALRAANYRPNITASALRTQRSRTIGLILNSVAGNPFFANVARSVEDTASRHGYKTIILNHNGSEVREREGVDRFIERRVDALLFCTPLSPVNVRTALAAGLSVVQVERDTNVPTPMIAADNYVGARDATLHLLELRHRRIAFVGGDPTLHPYDGRRGLSVEQERLKAYADALGQAGIDIDPDLVRLGAYYETDDGGSGSVGRKHMEALLNLPHPPTAVFATCDVLAAGVLQALYARRIHVPDEVSVIGFDDTLAFNLSPALTSVAQPMREMGSQAFRLAIAAFEGGASIEDVVLPTWLVLRSSTASVRPES